MKITEHAVSRNSSLYKGFVEILHLVFGTLGGLQDDWEDTSYLNILP
jgi:hypothetical protein